MRILYATNFLDMIRAGGFANDYLNDLLFHGLCSLSDVEVIDSTPILHLYKSSQSNYKYPLWGKAFTTCFLLDHDPNVADRTNIEDKIKDKYFDYIIYGAGNRSLNYYELAASVYDPKRIIIVDGDDSPDIKFPKLVQHTYFKREIYSDEYDNLLPIHFAIPQEKIFPFISGKKQKILARSVPTEGFAGGSFDTEKEYYEDYQQSKFGITTKKAGWDCMRHYEIMANSCIPLFYNIEGCPSRTLTNLDKNLLKECLDAFLDDSKTYNISKEIHSYTLNKLTTTNLAQYVLEKIAQ